MVVILQTYKSVAKFFGTHQTGREKFRWQLMAMFYLMTLIPILLAPLNSRSLKQMIHPLIGAVSCVVVFTYATHILINGVHFDLLENELQNVVDESKCKSAPKRHGSSIKAMMPDRAPHIVTPFRPEYQ